MTHFPASVLEAADPADIPALRVSTKYMETFVPVRPVSSGTELHTFLNRAGMLDLYSVGSDAAVHRLRRGDGVDAPYQETPLGIGATQLYPFTVAGGDADLPSLFGLDTEGKLCLATAGVDGAYTQRVTQPADATQQIRRFLAVRGTTGRIYVNVRLDDGALGVNYYDLAKQAWGGPVWAPVLGPDGAPAFVKDFTMAANDPVQSAIFAIDTNDEVLFGQDSFRTSTLRKLGKKASHLAAVVDAGGLLNVFAVEAGTGMLWLAKQRKYSTNGKIGFESWVRVDPGQGTAMTTIHAGLDLDNAIEIFATDANGVLHYTRAAGGSTTGAASWSSLFPIGAGARAGIFTVGRTANGYSEAYTVSSDDMLRRFWQSPQTRQWFAETLEIATGEDRLASVPTHAVEMIVVDAAGLPVPAAEVRISAAFLVTLWIDGKAYRASRVDPVTVRSGADGKVVVHQRATALAGAALIVETARTPAGSPILVQPNGQLQQKLARLDQAGILSARDAAGVPLLRADLPNRDAVASSLAEISRKSMEIASVDGDAAAIAYMFASHRDDGPRHRLDLRRLGEQAWVIDFTDGVPVYRNSSVEEVASYRAAALASAGVGGILGIDWGSVWNAIRDGVSWVVDGISRIAVSIVDGVANVLFEIAGKTFQAVLGFAQQALDFVEGVWNYLKVKLKQLYEWLAFLFDFDDFARTARGTRHATGVFLDFAADAVHLLRDRVADGIDSLKSNLQQISDTLVAELNGDGAPTLGGFAQQQELTEAQAHANDHNVFLNALQQNHANLALLRGGTALRSAADDPLDQLIADLKQLVDDFRDGDGKQAFEEAFAYFDAIGSDRDRALQLALSGLVKVLEGVAAFALDAAKAVAVLLFDTVEAIIRVVREALFAEWEIPIFSQLYELFSGGDTLTVTPVDVLAWIVAVPSTILSKVVLDRAPFPDAAALERFERTFTVAALRRRIGIDAADDATGAAGEGDPFWLQTKHNFLVLYCCGMVLRTFSEPGQIMLHAAGAGLGEAGIVIPALRLLTTLATAPWLMSEQAGAPGCTPGDPGFGVTIWICQLLCGPLRGLVIAKWVPAGQPKIYLGEGTVTLWGVANLVMTAWNFAAGPRNTATKLAFSRALTNLIPGQTLRFLAFPALNEGAYFVPAIVLTGLTALSYLGSTACAIAEIKTETAQGGLLTAI